MIYLIKETVKSLYWVKVHLKFVDVKSLQRKLCKKKKNNAEAMILGKAKADSERQIYSLLFPPLNNSATGRFHVSNFIMGMKLFHKPLSFHI